MALQGYLMTICSTRVIRDLTIKGIMRKIVTKENIQKGITKLEFIILELFSSFSVGPNQEVEQ